VGTVEEVKSNVDHHTRILKSFKALPSDVKKNTKTLENIEAAILKYFRKPKKEAGGASRLSDSDSDDGSVEQSEDDGSIEQSENDVSSDEEDDDQERKHPDVELEKKKRL